MNRQGRSPSFRTFAYGGAKRRLTPGGEAVWLHSGLMDAALQSMNRASDNF